MLKTMLVVPPKAQISDGEAAVSQRVEVNAFHLRAERRFSASVHSY